MIYKLSFLSTKCELQRCVGTLILIKSKRDSRTPRPSMVAPVFFFFFFPHISLCFSKATTKEILLSKTETNTHKRIAPLYRGILTSPMVTRLAKFPVALIGNWCRPKWPIAQSAFLCSSPKLFGPFLIDPMKFKLLVQVRDPKWSDFI